MSRTSPSSVFQHFQQLQSLLLLSNPDYLCCSSHLTFFPKGEVHTRVPPPEDFREGGRSFYRIEMQSLLSLLEEINLQILVVVSTLLLLFILLSLVIPMLYYSWNLSPTLSTYITTNMQINIALLIHPQKVYNFYNKGRRNLINVPEEQA